ncbi:bZIP transcription factor [Colletotrichum graminicola]|nr:bZIP transcription factor [Colletotrichum graminicola]
MAHTAVANTRTRSVTTTVVAQHDKYPVDNMTRSASAEPTKPTKRKGTRSVSTLTPSQLARKRANDREAQRAIRARTKEHIERLERELEELKSERGRDQSQTVQELLRKNKALEEELFKLRESMGVPNGQSYPNSGMAASSVASSSAWLPLVRADSAPVYDDNLSSISGAVPSPRSSPFPSNGDYNVMQELGPSYVPMPDASESWGPGIPVSVPSTVSSPSSSANTDEYGTGYIPTSVPAPMMDARSIPAKMDYDEVDSDAGYPHNHSIGHHQQVPMSHHHQSYLHHQQSWNSYPTPVYYQQPSAH